MEKNNLSPVYGFRNEKIIGNWNEDEGKFFPLSETSLDEASNDFLKGNDIYPLAIRIMDNKVEGKYMTYKAIGSKEEDPRVIIYAYKDEKNNLIIKK